ncbi:MAG TPA: glycosyl transferase family protein [Rhizomicrobium sp.]|jgi:adsorption protein B
MLLDMWTQDAAGISPLVSAIHNFLIAYWIWLQGAVLFAAVLIFLSGIDDAILDAMYWILTLFRLKRPPSTEAVSQKPEKLIAILIPAWQESDVIARMLSNLMGTQDYTNFHIFVGAYPNDPATQVAVAEVQARFPNVHCVVTNRPGPTSKADCLNQVLEAIFELERGTGRKFEMFVNQDAEDVVHPFSLKTMNWFIEGHGMVQLPVLSIDRPLGQLVAGHYMDEFAEWHGKDLVVRSILSGETPSAGVGTAFTRAAIDRLLATGEVFDSTSLTEDYDVAHRLAQLNMSSAFVRFRARMPYLRKAVVGGKSVRTYRKELVCTREIFPDRVRTSYRQKARWMLGISYFGWRKIGWYGTFWNRYFLLRDRKSIVSAPVAVFAYLLVIQYLLAIGLEAAIPGIGPLPSLVLYPWEWTLIIVNLLFLLNRLAHRAIFVARAHGMRQIFPSPLRAVVGNLIAFLAFLRAQRLYLRNLITSRAVAWDKTQHYYPTAAAILGENATIGDILQHAGLVTHQDLAKARAAQTERNRPLWLQLLDQGSIDDVALAKAFAEQFETGFTSFNALDIDAETRGLLDPADMARYAAYPVERNGRRGAVIAQGEPLTTREKSRLEGKLRRSGIRKIDYKFAPLSDVAFAIHLAHQSDPVVLQAQDTIDGMRKRGELDQDQQQRLWRAIRASYVRFGDLLVRRGVVDHNTLWRALPIAWRKHLSLVEVLRTFRKVPQDRLDEALAAHRAWRPDVVAAGQQTGLDLSARRAALAQSPANMRAHLHEVA